MESTEAVRALAALAQGTRLAAFRLLVEAGPEGMAAGAIAERLSLPAPTASFHLAQLANSGLIRSRNEGRFVIYAADFERMQTLIGFLTDNCCDGGVCAVSPLAPVAFPPRSKTKAATLRSSFFARAFPHARSSPRLT
jgi:ArsR family transcriptional regulator